MLQVKKYSAAERKLWNDFVNRSRNGTFLFLRDYMDYHSDRYHDFSLLVYNKEKLIALLPAHLDEKKYCSHFGLTYGGFVFTNKMNAALMLDVFDLVINFIKRQTDAEIFIYLPIPYIYASFPSQEDLYALFRLNAQLYSRKISSVVCYNHPLGLSELRKRKLKKSEKNNLKIIQDDDYASFWYVLENNLKTKYNAAPVHSLSEITLLHSRFQNNILLYRVCFNGETVAGCVLYVTKNAIHVQYIASSEEGRALCAVDYLFNYLIYNKYAGKIQYFDLGTSVEEGGRVLNDGLIFQKEGFGGRAVVYDAYVLKLR